MTDHPQLDETRLPFEIGRAIAATGRGLETVEGPLSTLPIGDEAVIFDSQGAEVARIPAYRLREVDAGLLLRAAGASLDKMAEQGGVGLADQLQAAINAQDGIRLVTPPEQDVVYLHVADHPLAAIHRRCVVVGWPDDQ